MVRASFGNWIPRRFSQSFGFYNSFLNTGIVTATNFERKDCFGDGGGVVRWLEKLETQGHLFLRLGLSRSSAVSGMLTLLLNTPPGSSGISMPKSKSNWWSLLAGCSMGSLGSRAGGEGGASMGSVVLPRTSDKDSIRRWSSTGMDILLMGIMSPLKNIKGSFF
jgi:hypothetical protein